MSLETITGYQTPAQINNLKGDPFATAYVPELFDRSVPTKLAIFHHGAPPMRRDGRVSYQAPDALSYLFGARDLVVVYVGLNGYPDLGQSVGDVRATVARQFNSGNLPQSILIGSSLGAGEVSAAIAGSRIKVGSGKSRENEHGVESVGLINPASYIGRLRSPIERLAVRVSPEIAANVMYAQLNKAYKKGERTFDTLAVQNLQLSEIVEMIEMLRDGQSVEIDPEILRSSIFAAVTLRVDRADRIARPAVTKSNFSGTFVEGDIAGQMNPQKPEDHHYNPGCAASLVYSLLYPV